MQSRFALLILVFAFLLTSCVVAAIAYAEVDKTSTVSRVIDGDTFELYTGETVRLADIDCPEYYESGYSEATDFLKGLIAGEVVYLDIDDLYETDKYGRLVCVVYISYNSTHWINVNKALLDGEYASIADYVNEFSPYSWSYFNEKISYPNASPSNIPTSPTRTPNPFFSSELFRSIVMLLIALGISFLIMAGIGLITKRTRRYRGY